MSADNIKYLIQSGHEIGYHTASHQRLSTIVSKKVLKNEIIVGADELELILNIKINHFSFSFGDLESFNEQALKLAKSRYKFIYTGMRGNNARYLNPLAIRRDTIAINDSNNVIGCFLLGAADFIYIKKFNIYESWVI
jgi:peptidoglycan/xylan/chitin deacetylase (PgdA/CDA1 family)